MSLSNAEKWKNIPPRDKATLRNQNRTLKDFGEWEILEFIRLMLEDEEQFIVLELPRTVRGVRYLQACKNSGEVCVQAGIDKGEHIELVEQSCARDDLHCLFMEFFESGTVFGLDKFRPVRLS